MTPSKKYETPSRVDKNQPLLVKKLRSMGVSVFHLSKVGQGCPDILCGYAGHTFVVEIKDERGKLTPAQIEWHSSWAGLVWVARTEEDIEKIVAFYSALPSLYKPTGQ